MGEMADMALDECMDNDEVYLKYCNAPAHIQYEHGLCDELGYMYSSKVVKLDRGPGKCPKCKSETILKFGKFGDFYGCTKFPNCKGSRCLK